MTVPSDPTDATCGHFVDELVTRARRCGGEVKIVAVPENWNPCFNAPGDATPRAAVTVAAYDLPGRGPSPQAG